MKGLTIDEAIQILRDGSRKYKEEEYTTAYGMAISALQAVDRLNRETWGKENNDIYETFAAKPDEEKELLNKLIRGEISGTQYDLKLAEIREKRIYEYDIHLTEAELKAIKHALTDLKWRDEKFSDRAWCREYGRQVSFNDAARARVELAVIKDILAAIGEVENET